MCGIGSTSHKTRSNRDEIRDFFQQRINLFRYGYIEIGMLQIFQYGYTSGQILDILPIVCEVIPITPHRSQFVDIVESAPIAPLTTLCTEYCTPTCSHVCHPLPRRPLRCISCRTKKPSVSLLQFTPHRCYSCPRPPSTIRAPACLHFPISVEGDPASGSATDTSTHGLQGQSKRV